MGILRGLDQLLNDLQTRQRPEAASKNKVLQKYVSINDTVGLSSDSITVTTFVPTYRWAGSMQTWRYDGSQTVDYTVSSLDQNIVWSAFQWT